MHSLHSVTSAFAIGHDASSKDRGAVVVASESQSPPEARADASTPTRSSTPRNEDVDDDDGDAIFCSFDDDDAESDRRELVEKEASTR